MKLCSSHRSILFLSITWLWLVLELWMKTSKYVNLKNKDRTVVKKRNKFITEKNWNPFEKVKTDI